LEEGDKVDPNAIEMLTKKRLRPRKEKIDYLEIAEGKK
jgi:hypothetical protein